MDKTAVMGVLERDGEVRAFVVEDRKKGDSPGQGPGERRARL